MSDFPALFDIGHRRYQADAVDEQGNAVASHAEPVARKVIYVGPPTQSGANSAEDNSAGARVTVDLEVGTPTDFGPVDPRDLMVYKGIEYEVVGEVADLSANPFRFHFGDYLHLRRVDG